MKRLLILISAFLLANCTVYSLVPQERVEIGDGFAVRPTTSWSRHVLGKNEFWTVDGLGLQTLQFTKGLADGEQLYEPHEIKTKNPLPKFNEKMSPLEIKDFLLNSSTAGGTSQIKEHDFKPIKLGTIDAYRAEFSFVKEDGLQREGFAIGFIKEKKLYLIIYSGAKLYYYGKHKNDVERLLDTIEIL